jgi:hypothetical protein
MDSTLGTDISPASKAIVRYLFLTMLLAVVYNLLSSHTRGRSIDRLLSLFLLSWLGSSYTFINRILSGQFDDGTSKGIELSNGGSIKESLFPTNLADVLLSRI